MTAAIREFFPECEVPEPAYAHLITDMPGHDLDDRVHMAAAIAGGAKTIVTWNVADFPAEPLAARGLQVCTPDRYLSDLLDAWPQEVMATVVRLAGEKRRPLLTPADLIGLLAKAGTPDFAERLRARLEQPDRS